MASTPPDIVSLSYDQLQTMLLGVDDLADKVWVIYNVKELMDKQKGITSVIAGVLYEGMRSLDLGAQVTNREGLSGELVMSVLLLCPTDRLGGSKYADGTNSRDRAVVTLGKCRDAIKRTKAPSGHKWRFVREAPALEQNGAVFWLQTWACPVILA